MKKALFILVAAISSFTAFSQTWIRVEEATKHKGHVINLVGLVTHVQPITNKQCYITLNGLSGKDSSHSLILVVKSPDRSGFKESLKKSYLNQYVQINGKVDIYKGKPQIVISNVSQISIAREPRRHDDWEPL